MGDATIPGAAVAIERTGAGARVVLSGDLSLVGVETIFTRLGEITGPGPIVVDGTGVSAFDTSGAWAIATLRRRLAAEGVEVRIEGLAPARAGLLETVEKSLPPDPVAPPATNGLIRWLEAFGTDVVTAWSTFTELLGLFGAVIVRVGEAFIHPSRLRFTSIVFHMQSAGLAAVPIASLMAFLIGVVLAYMGAVQLRQFGAEIFVVDLIAIAVLRELGILLTAIIVAGRSASAFTASIGSMKMREEIDAMRTLGLDPIRILVVPRVLALLIVLPLLGVVADLTGLLGGGVMAWLTLGVSPEMFIERLSDNIPVEHYLVGLIKAPFFALVIGLIGCHHGLKVEGNAESLGSLTSSSVVLAIFMVIVLDAIFAIFFATVGL
ncbi:phospholipid/cholesterol/gamma-HCH transport system permease protein [Amaricoccus macauensis]|uniref:Phospholipid/cholesterol/gamma-HCH transport system permease protein n=1 Tax=Amaricoccus macauensis TaxID=57001 RepID=A0A840SMX1_9RHOB|nr:phospholipid/cholesterol/gamma-HCH transport system permease protein [Amaricoccus macauensis]